MNIAGPINATGDFDLTTTIEMPDTPLSRRRMEHMATGGLDRPLKRNQYNDPTPVVDLRTFDERKCFKLSKQRLESSSSESISVQLKLDCGFDDRRRPTTSVRLAQSRIFYFRSEVEKANPEIWWTWMREDDGKNRSKEEYKSISLGPSSHLPFNPPHPPVVAKFKPRNERAVNRRLFSSSSSSVPSSKPYPYILSNNPRPANAPPNLVLSNDERLRRYANGVM